MADHPHLEEFFTQYVRTALWSSTYDPEGEDTSAESVPLDRDFKPSDLDPETAVKWRADCNAFLEKVGHLITMETCLRGRDPFGSAGHDFWLTRNHHGAGFWDGDWDDSVEQQLEDAAHSFPEVYPYVICGKVHS